MISVMAKRKTSKKSDSGNLHPQFNLRIPNEMRDVLERLATRNVRSATEEVRTALREYLERHGMWPPRDAASTHGTDE